MRVYRYEVDESLLFELRNSCSWEKGPRLRPKVNSAKVRLGIPLDFTIEVSEY